MPERLPGDPSLPPGCTSAMIDAAFGEDLECARCGENISYANLYLTCALCGEKLCHDCAGATGKDEDGNLICEHCVDKYRFEPTDEDLIAEAQEWERSK